MCFTAVKITTLYFTDSSDAVYSRKTVHPGLAHVAVLLVVLDFIGSFHFVDPHFTIFIGNVLDVSPNVKVWKCKILQPVDILLWNFLV